MQSSSPDLDKNYRSLYQKSIEEPLAFWQAEAEKIAWFQKPTQILTQNEKGYYRWFADGKLNTSYLATDYHVAQGRGAHTALIYDSPVTETKQTFSYRQLRDEVAQLAGVLSALGVSKGDTVIIYMPMIPQTLFAMLACARLGAIHSVVFGGFAAHELAVRIDDAKPKLILSASCGIEVDRVIPYKPLLDKALAEATHKPLHTLIFQREAILKADLKAGYDLDWVELLQDATPAECIAVSSTDPLYIIYTSGTTGKPKGIVRDNGGHAVAMRHSLSGVYDTYEGDTFWAASDLGWAVGHSYIVYAPLIAGCTTILYEGKPVRTPDAGAFWRVMAEHKVKTFFTAPTAIRAIRKEDPEGLLLKQYDLSHLKAFFLAGERCDPATLEWLQEKLGIPVIDHWWQTESGSPMLANPLGIERFPIKPGSAGKPFSGYQVQILDENGKVLPPHQEGAVVVKLPLPPGALLTIWNDDARFEKSYFQRFKGYYLTGDGGFYDEEGYFYIMGRIDDVINVAGHRLSTGEMEEIIASHAAVAECAVIGIQDALKGQVPVGLVVLKDGIKINEKELESQLVALVREKIGPVACFKRVAIVQRLPKTRSGKILRNVMRSIADGKPYSVPSTIDDPLILAEVSEKMRKEKIGEAFEVNSKS
jgi:acyl-coenzyme A synthetase/AMP-(fatty) acid ligase